MTDISQITMKSSNISEYMKQKKSRRNKMASRLNETKKIFISSVLNVKKWEVISTPIYNIYYHM